MPARSPGHRQLLLLLVSYRTPSEEIERLKSCLVSLSSEIGYAVVVNSHQPGEPVDQLRDGADYFLTLSANLGYGRAINRLVSQMERLPTYIGALNTDLSWEPGTFDRLLLWLEHHNEVCLAVPQILNQAGVVVRLCKQQPTLLALFSRRFWPERLKPPALKRYDRWFCMGDQDYGEIFDVPYLSGCCMLISSQAFKQVGGFDEQYFLYLEDADITRKLSACGRCVHLPVASVIHDWGRGNYRTLSLLGVNLISAWHYFSRWGLRCW